MKACLIYDFLTEYGGLERVMVNHANMLKEQGFDIEILTCHYDKDVLKKMGFEGFKVTNISSIKTPFEFLSLAFCFLGLNKIKKINADIFLSYSFPSNFLIRKKKAKRANYLNHLSHLLYFNMKDKIEWASSTQGLKRWTCVLISVFVKDWLKRLDQRLIKKNNLNFVNSKFTKKGLDKLYKIDTILSYPMLDPIFSPSKERIKENFIFSSSRIIPGKKYEWLIEACSYMKNKIPLYISGQYAERYKKSLEEQARRMNVKIKFLGKLSTEDLIKYYSSAALFAFPTPYFEFGLVPAESLACGTPIVVWADGGGQNDELLEGINGYGGKPHDLKDFAKKLDLLADGKFKEKNKEKIIASSKKFSYGEIKKNFIKEMMSLFIATDFRSSQKKTIAMDNCID